MKHSIIAVLLVFLLVLAPVGVFMANNSPEAQAAPATSAEPVINCTDIKIGQQVRIKCTAAGIVVLNTVVDLPVVQLPGATIKLPGETETITKGPTKTITATPGNNEPGATVTITKPAQPGPTTTLRPNGQPVPMVTKTTTETQTTTVTATPSATATTGGTIDPRTDKDDGVIQIPETTLDAPEAVGIGTLAVFLMALLILLGMYAGYYMGYKDSEKAEADFFRSLLRKNTE
jgi:hypothetical protein